ncbi:uncharacterized protein OCT59_030013 [Rhizophagus irregularis]|uniref:uncharacterized protein n=1 Tax=Rhizophagus irregularis TaxID=588596 RepID=UPI000CB1BA57|nr:hypothetical protein OCT59_030013 [Rhizophagus irregularis]
MQCVQFSGVCLASWPANMRPVVFSIMDFEISEETTTFSKLTKVAAKSFIQDLHKRYQTLLMKVIIIWMMKTLGHHTKNEGSSLNNCF